MGLELNDEHGGIMVNNELAACSDVYVAGDLCSFPSNLGRRRIQGSRDHDIETAIICAKNMLRNRKKSGMRKTTNTEEKEISDSPVHRYCQEPAIEMQIGGTQIAFVGLCNSVLKRIAFGSRGLDPTPSSSSIAKKIKTLLKRRDN